MRLFNDMVTSILLCDKPVVCRVNGMRIGGGQEIGMACDFSVAGDHARFGQAGPVHGSAPDGGATDFLHLYVGYAHAAESLVAVRALVGAQGVPTRASSTASCRSHGSADGVLVANPFADHRPLHRRVSGDRASATGRRAPRPTRPKRLARECTIDLSGRSTRPSTQLVTKLIYTFPDCTRRTLESLRKKKLEHWYANSESSRSWLSLNMTTEAAAGFAAFHYGDRDEREIDFVKLRRRLAEGARFDDALVDEVLPTSARARMKEGGR